MSRRDYTMTIDLMLRTWAPRINEAALAFERRWTRTALRNYNTKLADAFEQALNNYASAADSGGSTEIDNAGKRLVRAYAVISAALQAANVPDDAYMIGTDAQSGTMIIIAATPAAGEFARQQHPLAKWFSPDEVATLIAMDERAQKIAAVKASFPGAEIINVNGASK